MDDEPTAHDTDPADGPPPPPPPPSATLPPTPPPPPGPRTGSPAPTVGWILPTDLGRPTISIGSVVGRSFDTFGREWSLFLLLAAPAGLGAVLQSLLVGSSGTSTTGSTAALTAATTFSLYDLVPIIGAAILSGLLGLVSSIAIAVAADSLWQGHPIGEVGALRDGLRAFPRYLGVMLVMGLIAGGLALLVGAVIVAAAAVAMPLAIVLTVGLALVLFPVGIYVSARLALLAPVVVLERHGVLGSLIRAWELSRGHALVLFLLTIVVALSAALPLWGGSLFAASVDSPMIAAVALGIATLMFEPLPAIAVVLAWGDRIGDRHRDSELMARGRGRGVAALLVFGLGGILLVAGLGIAAQVASAAP